MCRAILCPGYGAAMPKTGGAHAEKNVGGFTMAFGRFNGCGGSWSPAPVHLLPKGLSPLFETRKQCQNAPIWLI